MRLPFKLPQVKPATKRALIVLAICAVCSVVVLTFFKFELSPMPELEAFTQDWRVRQGRKIPNDPRLVLVGVDKPAYSASDFSNEEIEMEPSLRLLQDNFPWSRAVWARLIERLANAGAKVIIIDFVFAAPSEGDDELHDVLEKFKDRVVVGYNINETISERRAILKNLLIPNSDLIPTPPIGSVLEDDRLGYVMVWTDWDDVLRRAQFRLTGAQAKDIAPPDVILESLASRALRKSGFEEFIPQGFEPRLFRYTAPPTLGYRSHSVGDVLSPRVWERNYKNGEFFRDKIVIVGPMAEIFHDVHPTPFIQPQRQMPGPEIHLNILNAALHREFLRETSRRTDTATILFAGLLAFILCLILRQPIKRLIAIFVLSVGYFYLALLLFNRDGLVILAAAPLLVLFFSSAAILSYEFVVERREKARVRKTLERYVSRDVVKDLLDNPQTFFNSLGGVRKPVTVLFSDVRSFTTMTESANEAQLVKQLNEYFEEMVALVFGHHGSLDKFIGDAVMAVWGSIVSHGPAIDAQNAVATALAMKRSLKKLNADWKARGIKEWDVGFGLNHGEVIVGNLGSSEKMELTVIGDAVNLASRLEGLTKEYHLDLLLGESVAKLVSDQYILRLVDSVQVKGKTKPVDVYTVMGDGAGQTVSLPMWLARYEEGVRQYRCRNFSGAAELFEESLNREPEDFLSQMYLDRCRALIENPPDDSWNGVFVMTKK